MRVEPPVGLVAVGLAAVLAVEPPAVAGGMHMLEAERATVVAGWAVLDLVVRQMGVRALVARGRR